ncbi:PilN domain-containing protein [Trichlorobacter ammonificans]|uniref:Fimbrial assembly family protein n=1 Tax=Trichlorobacter ammonificans TaxID=2916410 RepID=A0ABN8HDM1_9BACT|nr:PilN domain-containing protein [Trichlorobacter ammonificans]CAH2030787.1 Fimbrial assembly family protein [Trichlorobacter ammonificans]
MIRINLLPVRAAKKKETALQQLVILVAGILLVLVIVLGLWLMRLGQISRLNKDIVAAKAKIGELDQKIGKLNSLKKLRDEVKKKLDVLSQLRKNKTGPASRLAALSDITPDRLWLETYRESGADIKISGLAFSEELIAQFIRALEDSPEFEKVDLVVSEQKEVTGTKLKRFELTFRIEMPKPPPAQDTQQPKK